ncbi:hypothetical protein B0T26DRAFT_178738 [Lasiosphaeria miniovina]|uniref:Uncharacterized protein n=1 Tax=Lasiosphaeria miniovina TaxID=1954250 RepID=A0AA40B6P2_9PEZI|nr:uncharacterized protein B0T26DRAFT_178738 [Lasiosphaeria miniovina]KAK0728604.1 hypothetical protein B0T26DRAFT_178738 [Lasiosphaeria miniovina]
MPPIPASALGERRTGTPVGIPAASTCDDGLALPAEDQDDVARPARLEPSILSRQHPLPQPQPQPQPPPLPPSPLTSVFATSHHSLSRQNLKLNGRGREPLQLDAPGTIQSWWSGLYIEDRPHVEDKPHVEDELMLSSPPPDPGSPIEVDQPSPPAPESTLWGRQRSSTAVIDSRLENMIASEMQCTVYSGPQPAASSLSPMRLAPILEPRASPPLGLEVDDAYTNGTADIEEEERAFNESLLSLRRTGHPGGIRKHVGMNGAGYPLRFRLSADAALSCQNVVLSRPRMRRRDKRRPESSPLLSPQLHPEL